MWSFRPARIDDASEACDVIRRSIEDLCGLDHDGHPSALELWLSNKTPANVLTWIETDVNSVFVAEGAGAIAGVGAVRADGYVLLNYVAPWARFQGVSKGLMRTIEERAAALGNTRCTLKSTHTGHAFYLRYGYEDSGDPVPSFGGKPAYPMHRVITAPA